jgi:hypothetical protein
MIDLKRYKEEGFTIIRGLFKPEVPEAVLEEMDKIFAMQLPRFGKKVVAYKNDSTVFANMRALLESNVNVYLAAARHCAKLGSVQALYTRPEVLKVIKKFGIELPSIPSPPVVHIVSDQLRIPGGYYGTAPHQDWPSIQGGLGSIIIWIPVVEYVDEKRFPLEIIPRSHTRGLWDGNIGPNALEIKKELYKDSDFEAVSVRRGDAIVCSVFTVHRGATEECSGLRVACSMRYEDSAEKEFSERGYPCAYKRVVERQFIDEGFPPSELVAAIFKNH